MEEADGAAIMFMALCKQGRADAALKLALEASFPHLIVGLNKMADACSDTPQGEIDREFILNMERFLLDQKAGRPVLDYFRSLDVKSPEWQAAGESLAATVMAVFESSGLYGKSASHAALILRCLVRGFIVNEMSTPNNGLDFHESFALAVRMFICGLPELQRATPSDTEIAC